MLTDAKPSTPPTTTVGARFRRDELAQLDRLAAVEGMSRADVLRGIVGERLEQWSAEAALADALRQTGARASISIKAGTPPTVAVVDIEPGSNGPHPFGSIVDANVTAINGGRYRLDLEGIGDWQGVTLTLAVLPARLSAVVQIDLADLGELRPAVGS